MPPSGAVLVTGGAGYVGSHAAKALAEAGRRVVVLDDLSAGRREFLRWGTFVEGDAGDEALVETVCQEHGVTAAMHFAGRIVVEESVADPAGYWAANVDVTERLASALVRSGVRHLVFSSSAAVYGAPSIDPIPEALPMLPESPYGRTKAEAERRLAATGLAVAALRYFNAAGADFAAGLGEAHSPETHLIPLVVRAALDPKPLMVFGCDWATKDGTCVRDFIHVSDLADAHLLALERIESGRGGGVWNLGSGQGSTVLEVIAAVQRATGKTVHVVYGKRRSGDCASLVADATKARDELGWVPRRSRLDRIVADALAFAERGAVA